MLSTIFGPIHKKKLSLYLQYCCLPSGIGMIENIRFGLEMNIMK